ncbi:hypothetical protein NQ315_010360 [Exocentrus adspersus]|uniref:Uncharacterized protein n=1 Tax=Exocentrus adspersus TaxID=1586481 RepID=A0AAV8WBV8_9CUCU|nr:hypothetical protein NQ315_010360 [Exocentrus adspersus]
MAYEMPLKIVPRGDNIVPNLNAIPNFNTKKNKPKIHRKKPFPYCINHSWNVGKRRLMFG